MTPTRCSDMYCCLILWLLLWTFAAVNIGSHPLKLLLMCQIELFQEKYFSTWKIFLRVHVTVLPPTLIWLFESSLAKVDKNMELWRKHSTCSHDLILSQLWDEREQQTSADTAVHHLIMMETGCMKGGEGYECYPHITLSWCEEVCLCLRNSLFLSDSETGTVSLSSWAHVSLLSKKQWMCERVLTRYHPC